MLNRLVVPDVGEDGIEDGHVGAIGRHGDSRLSHESEQAQRFKGDGFAAGVGAGDDELTVSALELYGDRDYLPVFQFQVALEQGMSRAVEE